MHITYLGMTCLVDYAYHTHHRYHRGDTHHTDSKDIELTFHLLTRVLPLSFLSFSDARVSPRSTRTIGMKYVHQQYVPIFRIFTKKVKTSILLIFCR